MEHIRTAKVENVKLVDKITPKSSPIGTLYLTTSHLIFIDEKEKKELWILHMLMQAIEKPVLTTAGSQLKILCSNFLSVTFMISRDKDAHDVYTSLVELSKPKFVTDLYCFSYNPKGDMMQSTGWYFHDLRAEFQRQGVPNDNWIMCTLNCDYKLCPTYPKYLFVPSSASVEIVEGSAKFRSKGRFPVLSYLHENKAAIIRCAQPLVGISGVRSQFDESYVECLRLATPGTSFIYIIDTRPAVNAMVNKASGKGYETKYYENIEFSFKGIENIHRMRASLKHLVTSISNGVAVSSMESFMTELANSGWLKHVKAVLDTSVAVVQNILEGVSVIIHCSDGWDRTSQACALAQVMLDGYYRTIQGFQALIEKDWLAFGHKFQDRCGHIQSDQQETSPTFIQFLDAVWQLTQMFPASFQFNEWFLITIQEHVYSCQYGTFIGNCDRQREELNLRQKTYSLWGYIVSHNDEFVNPVYDRSTNRDVLKPNVVPQNIRFWRGLYCRFESGAHPREPIIDLLGLTACQTSSLEDHGRQLSKTIGYYTQKISSAKAVGAVVKALSPNVISATSTSAPLRREPTSASTASQMVSINNDTSFVNVGASNNADLDKVERKFADLKTSLMEKVQPSSESGPK